VSCDIAGSEYACVVVNRDAELRMSACRVHESHQSGILVHGDTAWLTHCSIYQNEHLGVLVERQAVAYISDHRICRCLEAPKHVSTCCANFATARSPSRQTPAASVSEYPVFRAGFALIGEPE
jgi:hypothetical protein